MATTLLISIVINGNIYFIITLLIHWITYKIIVVFIIIIGKYRCVNGKRSSCILLQFKWWRFSAITIHLLHTITMCLILTRFTCRLSTSIFINAIVLIYIILFSQSTMRWGMHCYALLYRSFMFFSNFVIRNSSVGWTWCIFTSSSFCCCFALLLTTTYVVSVHCLCFCCTATKTV